MHTIASPRSRTDPPPCAPDCRHCPHPQRPFQGHLAFPRQALPPGPRPVPQIADTARIRGIPVEDVINNVMLADQPTKKFVNPDVSWRARSKTVVTGEAKRGAKRRSTILYEIVS